MSVHSNDVEKSCEAYTKHLGLFYTEPTNIRIDDYHFMDYPSISSEDGDIIEFNILNTSGNYIDLRKTRITVKCLILQADSTNVPTTSIRKKNY